MDIDAAISAYSQLIEHVFSDKKMMTTSGSGTYKASKLEEELKNIVRDATGDENTRMMESVRDTNKCQVMVFAMSEHNLTASAPRIFRSYTGPNNEMPNCPIWQAIRASMAHPALFKSIVINDGVVAETLVGGDVGCSNPTRHVLGEVSAMHSDQYVSSIVCIGAGHARTIEIPRSNPLHRMIPTNVLIAMKNVATDSEKVAQEMDAQFQGTNAYWRLSVDQGMQGVRASHWQRMNEVVAHTRAYTHKPDVTDRLQKVAQAMVNRNAVVGVKYITGKALEVPLQQSAGVKRCPAPSPMFTGYERHVSQVIGCIVGPRNERRVCVIHGLGGAGKTQVALKSIERTIDKWADIVYVDATSRETAENALKGFAIAKRAGETCQDAIRWLEQSSQPWLLVFDNADDPGLALPELIPKVATGSVLVTTRLRTLGQLGQGPGCECQLSRMNREEAIELLVRRTRMKLEDLSQEENDAANGLVDDLGYLALAIVHSGAYVSCRNMSIKTYRNQCREQMKSMLERYSQLPANIEEYGKTVYTTWLMSFERLSLRAKEILWMLAYLHHDMIKEEIFKRAAANLDREPILPTDSITQANRQYVKGYLTGVLNSDKHWDANGFSTLVDELVSYSLIEYDRVNDAYTLHVLVHDWARSLASVSSPEAAKRASHLLAMSIDWSDGNETHTYRRSLITHVSGILALPSKLDLDDAAYFSLVYRDNGRWNEQERLDIAVLDARKEGLGKGHHGTLTSMNNLASTYWNQGRWSEAEALNVEVLEVSRRELGATHPSALTSMNNLASTYSNQGRWSEAEVLNVEVLEVRRRELGATHPDTLTSMANLASTYMNQGRWAEAEALNVEVLEVMRRELGATHPVTLTSMNNLASTYWNQGRWIEAEALNVGVLEVMRRELGAIHPDTLTSMANLALTYQNQGRWSEAEALNVEVLEVRRRELGATHPSTLSSMANLASTYWNQGRWSEAEALQVEVLEVRRRELGPSHPRTLLSMYNLSSTYFNTKQLDKAESLLLLTVTANKTVFGECHQETLDALELLSRVYREQGCLRENEFEVLQQEISKVKTEHTAQVAHEAACHTTFRNQTTPFLSTMIVLRAREPTPQPKTEPTPPSGFEADALRFPFTEPAAPVAEVNVPSPGTKTEQDGTMSEYADADRDDFAGGSADEDAETDIDGDSEASENGEAGAILLSPATLVPPFDPTSTLGCSSSTPDERT
ncbi:kinesin light chain [Ceratobasidium sp. AG-Ba]|nr:kinesin light chain [Ceratobasidium sp. AG-Ba]